MKNVEVIAELGWNFMGDMTLAERMIDDAKQAGASIAKFQYWNPKKLKSGPWDNDGRREIYEKAALDESKIRILKDMCKSADINFLLSAFNVDDAIFIKDLGNSIIKIPSHETHNIKLHEYAASNFEKCFVSLGAAKEEEVTCASEIYNKYSDDWVAMHCVSSYPLDISKSNLSRLKWLGSLSKQIGYSDHTESIMVPAFAVMLGATVIEKHFTSDKSLPGRDNKFALVKEEFKLMVENIENAKMCLINHGNSLQDVEQDTYHNYRGRWG